MRSIARLPLAVLGIAGVAGAALAQAPISFDPPVATAADFVIATVHQSGDCRLWRDGVAVKGTDVYMFGSAQKGVPCTPELAASLAIQTVAIGSLPAGRYRVHAAEQLSATPIDLVSFLTVVPAPDTSGAAYDIDPGLPTSDDSIALRVRLQWACVWGVDLAAVDGGAIQLSSLLAPVDPCPPALALDRTFTLPPLPVGDYQVLLDSKPLGGFHVSPPAQALSLLAGRFTVTLGWSAQQGSPPAPASAVALTDQSGYFWFFAPGNVELSAKVLDGRALNGHFWVFASALTDRPFALQVVDTANGCEHFVDPRCPTRVYSSPAGHGTNVLDLEAFPE